MVLYNGEIGLYTVVIVDVAFDRGGSVEVKGKVVSAQVPTSELKKTLPVRLANLLSDHFDSPSFGVT